MGLQKQSLSYVIALTLSKVPFFNPIVHKILKKNHKFFCREKKENGVAKSKH